MTVLAFLVSLCCFGAVVVASGPNIPHAYHVKGTIILTRAGVFEPFEAWVDPEKKMSRIDYYGGRLCFK